MHANLQTVGDHRPGLDLKESARTLADHKRIRHRGICSINRVERIRLRQVLRPYERICHDEAAACASNAYAPIAILRNRDIRAVQRDGCRKVVENGVPDV